MPLMTFAEYARHRKVSKAAVTYAVRDGRVSVVTGEDGKRAIDSDTADKQWYSNTAHDKHRNASEPTPLPPCETPPAIDDPFLNEDIDGNTSAGSYSTNRAIKEHFNARLAKLEFEEKSGRLLDAQLVQNEAFKVARTVRDSMLSIADRISSELAAEHDTFKVHAKLTDEIRKALISLKDEM